MDPITISRSHYDTIVESVEEVLKVLNKVNYDCDDTDPKSVVTQLLSNLKTIKENN